MPVRLTPTADAVISTKKVSMPEWDTEGPLAEHFDILVFLRKDVIDAARKAGRRTITEQNGRSRDEMEDEPYFRVLFDAQVKGWRLLDPAGTEIPFTPANLAALPWDIKGWLHEQILLCGGSVPTRDLVVSMGDSGQTLDYKRPDAGVGTTENVAVPDPQ